MRCFQIFLIALLLSGCGTDDPAPDSAAIELLRMDEGSFSKAIDKRPFSFPADHGAHPGFRSEWWYITGNLAREKGVPENPAEGREGQLVFGFQITLFRFALPVATDGGSPWHANQLWVAQFALTDSDGRQFFSGDRSARQAVGLAGAEDNGRRVWVEDVAIEGLDSGQIRIVAQNLDFGMELLLEPESPIVLNGDGGLSQKGAGVGNASYYYAIPRLRAQGSVRRGAKRTPVVGSAWLDREWSTSALDDNLEGWDWFALHFDDGRNLMVYRLRGRDGSTGAHSSLTLSDANGVILKSGVADGNLQPVDYWTSPVTGSRYPIRWTLQLGHGKRDLGKLEVRAVMNNQEHPGFLRYWEGAVAVSGTLDGAPVTGAGYLEMTGY